MHAKPLPVLVMAVAGLLPLAAVAPVAADSGQPAVRSITIKGGGGMFSSSLTVTLDRGVFPREADGIRDALKGPSRERLAGAAGSGAYEDRLWCNNKAHHSDSNGQWDIAYQCLSGRKRTVPWGFLIAPAIQATIAANVSEGGMFWWRNNVSMTKNAPHTQPASYTFHGNFNPVGKGDKIHCQDHMTFAMRVGGKPAHGSLTIVCNATLMN
ncbi:hypothetical protein [Microtetraspora malaysiensis]|uniref:Uncharacterized protein n=1 Tax=Microtetraspora malaysiensis TaxID=161358 RepID=A0ABW6T093_9ACTN